MLSFRLSWVVIIIMFRINLNLENLPDIRNITGIQVIPAAKNAKV